MRIFVNNIPLMIYQDKIQCHELKRYCKSIGMDIDLSFVVSKVLNNNFTKSQILHSMDEIELIEDQHFIVIDPYDGA